MEDARAALKHSKRILGPIEIFCVVTAVAVTGHLQG